MTMAPRSAIFLSVGEVCAAAPCTNAPWTKAPLASTMTAGKTRQNLRIMKASRAEQRRFDEMAAGQ